MEDSGQAAGGPAKYPEHILEKVGHSLKVGVELIRSSMRRCADHH
jgi:hypothetical protein